MNIEDVKKVAVIGAGMMGNQIAEVLSRVGRYEVHLVDINENFVKKGLETIANRLDKFFVAKGKMTDEEKKKIMERIKGSTSQEEALKDVDIAIEAATETLSVKKDIFKNMSEKTPQHAILTSNTSFQNITEMASVTKKPDKVVGTHFFNPVGMMKLVEIVKGAHTSDETVEIACGLARKLEKDPVICKDISYGFLANRAYTPLAIEAVQMLWERVAPPEDIDKALKLGYNLPMGPLELFDFVGGWNVVIASEQDAIRELGPEKGRLHPLIRMMSRAGYSSIYAFWKDILSKW